MIVSNCFSEDEEKVVSLTHQKYRDQKNNQKSK